MNVMGEEGADLLEIWTKGKMLADLGAGNKYAQQAESEQNFEVKVKGLPVFSMKAIEEEKDERDEL